MTTFFSLVSQTELSIFRSEAERFVNFLFSVFEIPISCIHKQLNLNHLL